MIAQHMGDFMREYTTARTIFGILEFVAWVAVVGGIIVAIMGASAATGFSGRSAGLMGSIPGFIMAFLGIIAVATVQFYRAGVDTAEMTGKMLQISKEQLQLTKEAQKASFAAKGAPATPATAKAPEPATTPADFDPVKLAERKPNGQDAATNVEAATSTVYQYKVEHQGETIGLANGKAIWGGQAFDTVDAAKEYVTSVKGSGRTEPIVASPDDRPQLTANRAVPQGLS